MSGQALLGDARAFARSGWLPPALVDPALSVCDPRLLQFLFEAGCDAGLDYRLLAPRLVAVVFQHAAVQLSDDLSDGDCDYLHEPSKHGPLLVALLQNAFQAALNQANISRAAQLAACTELARVGQGQLRELALARANDSWDLAAAQYVATTLNGSQLAAYLHLTWDGTAHAERAQPLGIAFGRAVHVATDRTSQDARLLRLPQEAQVELLRWATSAALAADALGVPCVRHRVPTLLTVLGDAA